MKLPILATRMGDQPKKKTLIDSNTALNYTVHLLYGNSMLPYNLERFTNSNQVI